MYSNHLPQQYIKPSCINYIKAPHTIITFQFSENSITVK